MSSIARWSYTNIATVWPQNGTDEWGQPIYGAPYTIACTWADTGDVQTSADGTEFVPASTFWYESEYSPTSQSGSEYATSNGQIYTTLDGQQYITAVYQDYLLQNGQAYITNGGGQYQSLGYNEGVSSMPIPRRDDFIAKFDQTSIVDPHQADAQKIKKITSYDMSPFGSTEIPDWEAFT